jgi:hypothetical protein
VRPKQRLAISDNWNFLMRPHDMKYISFKHQRENKQISHHIQLLSFDENSDKIIKDAF